jgi:prepilin signal peptidase PulO-like enzyme (type II secretory pathway)
MAEDRWNNKSFLMQMLVVCAVLGVIALVDFLFFLYIFITMLPSYVYVLSASVTRMSAITSRNAVLFNLAGMLPWAPQAVSFRANEIDKLFALLTSWWVFGATWGTTLLIIATTYVANAVGKAIAAGEIKSEVKKIREEQSELVEEWGLDVVSGSPPPAVTVVPAGQQQQQGA